MQLVRYHNRSAEGAMTYTEIVLDGERFRANLDMGFVELPDTAAVRQHAQLLRIFPMETAPTIPVALADPRIIQQHADAMAEMELRITTLGKDFEQREVEWARKIDRFEQEAIALRQERDVLVEQKAELLTRYERAVHKITTLENETSVLTALKEPAAVAIDRATKRR